MGERDTITGNARNAATVGAQRTGRGYLREWYNKGCWHTCSFTMHFRFSIVLLNWIYQRDMEYSRRKARQK